MVVFICEDCRNGSSTRQVGRGKTKIAQQNGEDHRRAAILAGVALLELTPSPLVFEERTRLAVAQNT
jgi:hypothetical protein